MGEMAQIFISEIEWLAVLKFRATCLSTSLFPTESKSRLYEKFSSGLMTICQDLRNFLPLAEN